MSKPNQKAAQAAEAARLAALAAEEATLRASEANNEHVDMQPALESAPASASNGAMAALVAQVVTGTPAPAPSASISAKQAIRNLLSADGTEYTVAQLCALSGKTHVNIVTALSDLRSSKYAGKGGVFVTKSTKKADGTYYSKAS